MPLGRGDLPPIEQFRLTIRKFDPIVGTEQCEVIHCSAPPEVDILIEDEESDAPEHMVTCRLHALVTVVAGVTDSLAVIPR